MSSNAVPIEKKVIPGRIHYREGDFGTYRAWLDGWAGDMFVIISKTELETLKRFPNLLMLQEEVEG